MHSALGTSGTAAEFRALIQRVLSHEETAGLLILAGDDNRLVPADVDPVLQALEIPVVGGVFPAILHEGRKYDRGTLVIGLPTRPNTAVIAHLSHPDTDLDNALLSQMGDADNGKTMLVWMDGLSHRIRDLVDAVFNLFGLEHNYIGGGAGSLSFEQRPCLFTNRGFLQDSAVIASLDLASGVAVSHGWQSVSGPYKVTEADGNTIHSLNWQPAYAVYRSVIRQTAGHTLTSDNFFTVAKAFPFGINRLGAEKIVRDPILVDDNDGLVCVGDVPSEVYVDILSGTPDSLVAAASTALRDAVDAYPGAPGSGSIFVIDCISRALFLEDHFEHELACLNRYDAQMFGALTLGEIANNRKDFLEFYNKTVVVGILENGQEAD